MKEQEQIGILATLGIIALLMPLTVYQTGLTDSFARGDGSIPTSCGEGTVYYEPNNSCILLADCTTKHGFVLQTIGDDISCYSGEIKRNMEYEKWIDLSDYEFLGCEDGWCNYKKID